MLQGRRQKAEVGFSCFLVFISAMLISVGCAPKIQKPVRICPGKASVAEALSVLKSRSENAVPLKANGRCLLEYYAEGKKHKENFPVKLWVNPPNEIYLQGDVAFDPKGIVLGSNEREFWLAIKLKEISSYWRGQWSEERPQTQKTAFGTPESCFEKLMISPRLALEALGATTVGGEENWSLSKEETFDVLIKRNNESEITKKIYVQNCDYLVGRIEYLDVNGRAMVITELDKYKEIGEGFCVPSRIKIIRRTEGDGQDSITITLGSIKSAKFSERLRNHLFTPVEPRGFKHIYKIDENCDIIEQPQ